MSTSIPKRFTRFLEEQPEMAEAYEKLGEAVHKAGPLDPKTRALIKVAISGGARLEGGFHAHVRKAMEAGCAKEEVQHVAYLTLPTLGFPTMMTLQSWIDDVYNEQPPTSAKASAGKQTTNYKPPTTNHQPITIAMTELDLAQIQKNDPLKRLVEKETGQPEFSPMDPPEAFSPPETDEVPYEELHPLIRQFVDEHKACLSQIDAFEKELNSIRETGMDLSYEGTLGSFFEFFDKHIIVHNRNEEKSLFPLLKKRMIDTGNHSKGKDRETAVDMLEDDHIRALQIGAVSFNLLALSVRIQDPRSRLIVLDAALEQSRELVELLRLHIFREDKIVFGLAQKLLTRDELDGLLESMPA